MLFEFLSHFLPWTLTLSEGSLLCWHPQPQPLAYMQSAVSQRAHSALILLWTGTDDLFPDQSTCDKPCLCGITHESTKCRHLPIRGLSQCLRVWLWGGVWWRTGLGVERVEQSPSDPLETDSHSTETSWTAEWWALHKWRHDEPCRAWDRPFEKTPFAQGHRTELQQDPQMWSSHHSN